MSLWSPVAAFDDPDQRPTLYAFGVLLVVLIAAALAGDDLASKIAVALLVAVPLAGVRVVDRQAAPVFFLVAAFGAWLALQKTDADPSASILLLQRIAYFAVPPLLLGLVLADHDRERLHIGPVHLYAPAVVMIVLAVVHLGLRRGVESAESEVRTAASVYSLFYAALIFVAFVMRVQSAPVARSAPPTLTGGAELEDTGRFALAARAYEREGQIDRAAETAERAGDWARAGRLCRQAGNDFNAGEMFYRAQMWPEALDSYERARAIPAAARLCLQLGEIDRAARLFEQAGDPVAVVKVLEEAGRTPTADQYRRAGMMARAAEVLVQAGDWRRAADIHENELHDPGRAADLHLGGKSFLAAGRLLEAAGRKQEALEAYAADPAGALDAARLYMAAGRAQEAADLLARLPAAEVEKLDDETALTMVARVMMETGRPDDALRMLQGLKRRGSGGGAVRLLLGRAFLDKGMTDLAEEELRAATSLSLEPADEMKAAYLLGCVLEQAGRPTEALPVFHELLQKDFHYQDVQDRYKRLKAASSTTAAASAPQPQHAPAPIGFGLGFPKDE